jgi:hypothetical protein
MFKILKKNSSKDELRFKKCYGLKIAMALIIHFCKILSIFACLYTFPSPPKVSEGIQKSTNVQPFATSTTTLIGQQNKIKTN